MKMNKWTMGLAAAGVVSLASTAQAEENSVLTALSSTVISGNVEASYVGGFSTNNNLYSDGAFEANGASISIGSPLGEGDYTAGYNVELLFGERATAFAGYSRAHTDGAADNFLLKNANIGLNLPFGNGVDLTVGLFDTIVGYEVEASGANPNVMRSYGYQIEPFTHTGVLASTSVADGVNISLGLTNGFDSTGGTHNDNLDAHAQLGYLAALDLTAPDSLGFLGGSTAYIGFVGGNNEGNAVVPGSGSSIQYEEDDELFYVGLSLNTPIENLSLGLAYDDRQYADDRPSRVSEADAVALYAVYQLSDSLSIAARYDTVNLDEEGGGEDNVEMATLTLDYQVWENVLTRLEFGWESGAGPIGTAGSDSIGRLADSNRSEDGTRTSAINDSSYFALNFFYQF
jgi:hypothetical protein